MKVITLIDSNTKELVNFEEIAEIPSGFEPDGILFARKDGKNYKRVVDYLNPEWFGAKKTLDYDSTLAIKNMLRYVSIFPNVIFPLGKFKITENIIFPNTIKKLVANSIYCDNCTVTIGEKSKVMIDADIKISVYNVKNQMLADCPLFGLKIINANSSRINVDYIYNFKTGLLIEGNAGGNAYNTYNLGTLLNCQKYIVLDAINNGWVNENLFNNGRIQTLSNFDLNVNKFGLIITSSDKTYLNNNNNTFLKTSFEIGRGINEAKSTPVMLEYAAQNYIINARNEGNDQPFLLEKNKSTDNTVIVGYGNNSYVNESEYGGTFVKGDRLSKFDFVYNIFNFNFKKIIKQDNSIELSDIAFYQSSLKKNIKSEYYNIDDNYLELKPNVGIITKIDCAVAKQFIVGMNTDVDFGGRISVKCYDVDNNVINEKYSVKSFNNSVMTYNSAFGGVFRTGSDFSRNLFYFSVSEKVKKIELILAGISKSIKISSFSVHSVNSHTNIIEYENLQ